MLRRTGISTPLLSCPNRRGTGRLALLHLRSPNIVGFVETAVRSYHGERHVRQPYLPWVTAKTGFDFASTRRHVSTSRRALSSELKPARAGPRHSRIKDPSRATMEMGTEPARPGCYRSYLSDCTEKPEREPAHSPGERVLEQGSRVVLRLRNKLQGLPANCIASAGVAVQTLKAALEQVRFDFTHNPLA